MISEQVQRRNRSVETAFVQHTATIHDTASNCYACRSVVSTPPNPDTLTHIAAGSPARLRQSVASYDLGFAVISYALWTAAADHR